MPDFKDHFSRQSAAYGRYRPQYPDRLFAALAQHCRRRDAAWDCGCGSGQAAHGLIRHFRSVVATDASAAQIAKAAPEEGITYRVATAEESGLADDSVDLVLVAQALHWFDFERFYREVRRVGRAGAVLAGIAYGLFRVAPDIDRIVDRLYGDLLGADWPPERRHIDDGYASIPFPFRELPAEPLRMQAEWDVDHCLGYLETWSAVQRHRRRSGRCPVRLVADELRAAWGGRVRTIVWPLFQRIGRIA